MNFDISGIQDLIIYLLQWFVDDFNVRTIDTDTIPQLLTTFAPIWNPIWEVVNGFLGEWFGF